MKYCDSRIDEIIDLIKRGLCPIDAAILTGISRATFYRWYKYPGFGIKVNRAESENGMRQLRQKLNTKGNI